MIAETLAWLPFNVYKRLSDGGRRRDVENPVDWMLSMQANPEISSLIFREAIMRHALIWGNGYAEIERDGAGRPIWLWLLTPDRVYIDRDDNGDLYYEVYNGHGRPSTELYPGDVLHLKGPSFDGLKGLSVIQYAARCIGLGISAEQSSSTYFANDSTPGGLLKHPGKLGDHARKNLRETWQATHGGSGNRRTVAILEEGMEWQQTSLPPEDSQLVETRQLGPLDICRFFRMQPHKIAELSRATFSNIEQQSIEHVTDTLMPWANRLESECNIKLFGRVARGQSYTKHNFNALMRGDADSRSRFYHSMLSDGVFCINDVLELEDRNPIGPDGDVRFVPMNMQPLEIAVNPPKPAPAPSPIAPTENDPAANDDPTAPDPAQIHAPIFAEALGRCWRRAQQRAEAAIKKDAGHFAVWLSRYRVDHEQYMLKALSPAAVALAMLLGAYEPADVDSVLRGFVAEQLEQLSKPGQDIDANHAAARLVCAIKLAVQGKCNGTIASIGA